MAESMMKRIDAIYGVFKLERGLDADPPSAIRMHPDDWYALLHDVRFCAAYRAPSERPEVLGMVPLIDIGWMKGFPVVLDRAAAADAIEAGARAA